MYTIKNISGQAQYSSQVHMIDLICFPEDAWNENLISEELIKEFIGTLNECEFARYAPGNQNDTMDKVYTSAIEVISKMENSIKR